MWAIEYVCRLSLGFSRPCFSVLLFIIFSLLAPFNYVVPWSLWLKTWNLPLVQFGVMICEASIEILSIFPYGSFYPIEICLFIVGLSHLLYLFCHLIWKQLSKSTYFVIKYENSWASVGNYNLLSSWCVVHFVLQCPWVDQSIRLVNAFTITGSSCQDLSCLSRPMWTMKLGNYDIYFEIHLLLESWFSTSS